METSIGRGCAHGMPVLVRVLVRVGLDQQTKTCELARGARLSRVCAGENPGSTALYFYLFDLVLVYAQTEKR